MAESQQHHGRSLHKFIRMLLAEQPCCKRSSPCSHVRRSQQPVPQEGLKVFSRAEGSSCHRLPMAHLQGAGVLLSTQVFFAAVAEEPCSAHAPVTLTSVLPFVTRSCPRVSLHLLGAAALPSKAEQAAQATVAPSREGSVPPREDVLLGPPKAQHPESWLDLS